MSGPSRGPGADELLKNLAVLVGPDGEVGDLGERHWLCPATMTPRDRELLERISKKLSEEVVRQCRADRLGSIGDLYDQVAEEVHERGGPEAERRAVWNQLMAMSLGYWLDCLVVEEVMDALDVTEAQVLDVALLREAERRTMAAEDADGGRAGSGDE
jgi:hypothetical protein